MGFLNAGPLLPAFPRPASIAGGVPMQLNVKVTDAKSDVGENSISNLS